MEEEKELSYEDRTDIFARYTKAEVDKLFEKLRRIVYQCIDDEKRWRDKTNRDKEIIMAEIRNEHDEENRTLKSILKYSVATLHSDLELERYKKFCDQHEECRLKTKIDGGKMPYVVQYGTGIGVCTKVYCQACGKFEDITDNSVW